MANRWLIYQRERFPVMFHAPLIAAFSLSAVVYSSRLRGLAALPDVGPLLVAFLSLFLFFLQLRIADEFKDAADDARFRPYRPVPRGLVSLRELGGVGAAAGVIQLGLALWLQPSLALLLVSVWLYFFLMCKEFFAPRWLKSHPFTYLWTHMLIMPLIAFYATACDRWRTGPSPGRALLWFLLASFLNGVVIEIGRKIRAPKDEEPGVVTYSALLGRRNAVLAWLGAILFAATAVILAADRIGPAAPVFGLLAASFIAATLIGWQFLRLPMTKRGKSIEHMSGIWTLISYVALGMLPISSSV